jgi:NADH-quinone oxidoreductase subunit L
MVKLAWLIPTLPLLAWAVILLVGKRTPGKGAPIGIVAVGVGWVLSIGILAGVIAGDAPYSIGTTWAPISGQFNIPIGIDVDGLAAVLLFVVTTVSLFVQIYSVSYMRGDERYTIFFSKLSLFTAGMLIVVLANNLLMLLVGWEIMGICSYFLIGHYWEDHANSRAAIKAFLTTRVGDLGFMAGIFVLFWGARSFEIPRIVDAAHSGALSSGTITLGAVLLFCGAIGKSGQFPLHTWLPDAMAGPTPVSALIHAATMVAAGVFLVGRMYPVFEASPGALNEVAIIGAVTMLIAAMLALIQDDIKRVLAYSTVSQLAYMMAGLGVGGYTAGIFHLFTHAFFKALLFLAAGSVIHSIHTNNLSEMGGLRKVMPWTFWTFTIGALSLAGIIPLSGFWSKDEILNDAWRAGFGGGVEGVATSQAVAQVVFVIGVITAFLTAFYVARMLWLAFGGSYRGAGHPHESDTIILVPLVVLAIGSVFAGVVGSPLIGSNNIGKWISTPLLPSEGAIQVNWGLVVLSTVIAVLGIAAGGALYRRGLPEREYLQRVPALYTLLERKYFLDDLYEGVFVRAVTGQLAPATYWFDQRVIDGVVNGAGLGTRRLSRGLRYLQSGQAQWYAAALFVGVIGLAVVVVQVIGR